MTGVQTCALPILNPGGFHVPVTPDTEGSFSNSYGTCDFPGGTINLAWTGIGQYHDMINPFAMMMYVGAIGGGGTTAEPHLIKRLDTSGGLPATLDKSADKKTLLNKNTAKVLADMMRNKIQFA